MAIVSTFCKKGGVGKTTIIGFLAHYYATKGNKVLVISVDDQNSIFKIFGIEEKVFDEQGNYLEFLLAGHVELGDVLIEARENLYLIKTLNTDKLSLKMTLERNQEKAITKILKEYNAFFDYIFIDFPPSSSRLSEVLLDLSDVTMIVVGLDSLGLGGFINTIQYFIDNDLDIDGIKYIIPNGYSRNRRAPRISLEKLIEQAREFTPNAIVVNPLQEKSVIKNLQAEGISPFDAGEYVAGLSYYDSNAKQLLETELVDLLNSLQFK